MIYHYICQDCDKEFLIDVPMTTKIERNKHIKTRCPRCLSKKVKKLLQPAPVHFKGTGWGGDKK